MHEAEHISKLPHLDGQKGEHESESEKHGRKKHFIKLCVFHARLRFRCEYIISPRSPFGNTYLLIK